jgi:alpha-aminoadipate carrier protein LysW
MSKIRCPECALEFDAGDDLVVGEIVSCPDCGLELEVCSIGKDRVTVSIARVEGEDWGE